MIKEEENIFRARINKEVVSKSEDFIKDDWVLLKEIEPYFDKDIYVEQYEDTWKEKKEFLFITDNWVEVLFTRDQLEFL